MFGVRQGKVEFIGTPDADYNDFILAERDQECISLFMDYLQNLPEKYNCAELVDIPESAKYISLIGRSPKSLKPVHRCPYVILPKSSDGFLQSLRRKLRQELRRNMRMVERAGLKMELVDYSHPQLFTQGMQTLFELHQKRWETRGFSGAFAEWNIRSFNLEVAQLFAENGWLGLYVFELSGKPAAVSYGFKYGSKYYAYLPGFDPSYAKYGVGNLLSLFVMNKCIEEGLNEFDFMRGAEAYKERWNAFVRVNYQAKIPKRGFMSNVRNWLYENYWHQGTRLKYVLKIKQ
jgi:CelD/BcsL family acetyltransferase involved in cellulose biosynthesis